MYLESKSESTMKFVALISGGKDSLYSTLECVRNGHELVACVHLGAPVSETEESYMYQTAASEVIPILVEDCLCVPLVLYQRIGTSVNTSLMYQTISEGDEVEDLFLALKKAKQQFPDVKGVSSGAILSTYQRMRIEHVCSRLGLTSLSYLWRIDPQHILLKRMLDDGIEAILVKVACPPGLIPHKHLNKTIGQLYNSGILHKLHDRYQFQMCGEGGEYESLVLDCPLYKKKLIIDEVEIVESSDGVGSLIVKKCHTEAKVSVEPEQVLSTSLVMTSPLIVQETKSAVTFPKVLFLPHVQRLPGGLLQTSEIISSAPATGAGLTEADCAAQEALDILKQLGHVLRRNAVTPADVMFVHLYLSEISHFDNINNHYCEFFGTFLPSSRTCVAVGKHGLPGGRRVLFDCLIQCGSGAYLRSSKDGGSYVDAANCSMSSKLRDVLHVQSLSYWAPVCVGPYSQVNTLRSGIHFLAGQVGLKPSSMTLHETWTEQFEQCWTNIARILDALDGSSLEELLSCLIYVSDNIKDWGMVELIARNQIAINGGVVPGAIDDVASVKSLYGGYEDEETWREITQQKGIQHARLPLLLVSIPEMPVGAQIEIESICCTKKSSSCLEQVVSACTQNTFTIEVESNMGWDCGYDFSTTKEEVDMIHVESISSSIGNGCASMCTITANLKHNSNSFQFVDVESILGILLQEGLNSLKSSGLNSKNIVNVRVYHLSDLCGIGVRTALVSALRLRCNAHPASSVIPVKRIMMITDSTKVENHMFTVLAIQLLVIDSVQLDTDIWTHHARQY